MAAFDTLVGAAFVATARSRSPSFTDRSLRRRSELSLFRFEGVALRVVPGDVPFGARLSPRWGSAWSSSRALRELLEARASFLLSAQVFRVPAATAHPVRALVGRFVPAAFRFGLFDGEW